MKFFNKTTKEVYYFDADQVQHALCQDKIKDPNFVEIPDTFDPNFDTFDLVTSTVNTDKALVLQTAKLNKLQLALDVLNTNNESPVTYKNVQYQAGSNSVNALAAKISAIQAGWVVPTKFKWKALDNSLVLFTAQDIKSLYLAIELRNQTNWTKYQTLKTKIEAAKTITALKKIKV